MAYKMLYQNSKQKIVFIRTDSFDTLQSMSNSRLFAVIFAVVEYVFIFFFGLFLFPLVSLSPVRIIIQLFIYCNMLSQITNQKKCTRIPTRYQWHSIFGKSKQ